MKAWTLILALGLPSAALLGWQQVTPPSGPGVKPVVQPVRIPEVDHSGVLAAVAFAQLEKFAPPVVTPAEDMKESPDMDAEEPIEMVFRRSISAVMGAGKAISLVIMDPADQNERRTFRLGQEFHDGWKIVDITPQMIGLKKGGELKEIPLFDGAKRAGPEPAAVPEDPPPGPRRRS